MQAAIWQYKSKTKKQEVTEMKQEMNQLWLFTFKRMFLKMSVGLQTALAAEARPAGQKLAEQQRNMIHFRYVPSRNSKAGCFEASRVRFRAIITTP
jgi:hypothetical protein